MKKILYSFGFTLLLSAGIITSCNSPSDKADRAAENVEDAQQELDETMDEAQKNAATPEEWAEFKSETELKIKENEVRIAELKVKMMKPGVRLDSLRQNRINTLEEKNDDLRAKLKNYESNKSDWESFKREFNHDMDEIGKALKDLTVDNKK